LKAEKINVFTPFKEIGNAIGNMPKVMWQLALVYLFQWYALFCYWQNASKSIAQSVWNTTVYQNNPAYDEAVGWSGLVNGWYNHFCKCLLFTLVGEKNKSKNDSCNLFNHGRCWLISVPAYHR
jgi:maltose/moltooligosaccharide transporter